MSHKFKFNSIGVDFSLRLPLESNEIVKIYDSRTYRITACLLITVQLP